ncbi:MAG: peptide-methionine (S)-S-oxide reductase MsrA [Pirellulaceae bacterium]
MTSPELCGWITLGCLALAGCGTPPGTDTRAFAQEDPTVQKRTEEDSTMPEPTQEPSAAEEVATLGAGCFWCVEAVFQQLKGVTSVQSGYSGGHVPHPTYEQVCGKKTGHAEVCQIRFDPQQIRFEELLEVFWKVHDPTTLNRQGADEGPQYRSVIFYHSPKQRELAEKYKQKLNEVGAFRAPVVTEITSFTNFFPAEDYHQNYYRSNSYAPYCRLVIQPKLDKLREVFGSKLKPSP